MGREIKLVTPNFKFDEKRPRRNFRTENATWVQVWETVTEGSPVSPPFATREELINYLVEVGDFWDQNRGTGGWSRKAAESFVASGWAPSMIVSNGKIYTPKDGMP